MINNSQKNMDKSFVASIRFTLTGSGDGACLLRISHRGGTLHTHRPRDGLLCSEVACHGHSHCVYDLLDRVASGAKCKLLKNKLAHMEVNLHSHR